MKNLVLLPIVLILTLGLILTACNTGGAERLPQEEKKSDSAQTAGTQAEAAPVQAAAGDSAEGQKLFAQTCSACHGPTGEGLPGLGKDMTHSEFIAGQSDDELFAFIKVGRDPSDPLNTTGVAMPPKGGNPALDDAGLQHIIAYIRTLHKK